MRKVLGHTWLVWSQPGFVDRVWICLFQTILCATRQTIMLRLQTRELYGVRGTPQTSLKQSELRAPLWYLCHSWLSVHISALLLLGVREGTRHVFPAYNGRVSIVALHVPFLVLRARQKHQKGTLAMAFACARVVFWRFLDNVRHLDVWYVIHDVVAYDELLFFPAVPIDFRVLLELEPNAFGRMINISQEQELVCENRSTGHTCRTTSTATVISCNKSLWTWLKRQFLCLTSLDLQNTRHELKITKNTKFPIV